MATAGRRPKGPMAASNSERKKQFDLRMRNANGEVPGAPQRSPVVIYLSEEARDVLRRNRDVRRLVGAPPVLDAELVEYALACYERGRLGVDASTVSQHSDGRLPLSSSLDRAAFKALQSRVNELEQQVIKVASNLENDKYEELREQALADLPENLLEAHAKHQAMLIYPMAQRLLQVLRSTDDDTTRMRLLQDEIADYLDRLLRLI